MLKVISFAAVFAVLALVATAYASKPSSNARSDCPGKIICPFTGDLVCRDRCPTVDPNRGDCPGRIECPPQHALVEHKAMDRERIPRRSCVS